MIKDLVSIIIPTYNDEKYLKESLDDMLNQTYQQIEVIVVNDGSTDKTEEILKEYAEKYNNFSYVNKSNGGTGSALNRGFSLAKGEFATWVSSDDRKKPNMIEVLVNFLKKNRDCEYVVSSFYSQHFKNVFRTFVPFDNKKGFIYNSSLVGGSCSGKSFIVDEWVEINRKLCHSGVNYMFTMRLKNECGDFLTIPGEDYYMSVIMASKTRVGFIDENLGEHKNPIDSLSVKNRACVNEANLKTWEFIENQYKPWNFSSIPKIAHFYWGSDKMSFLRYMTLYSFKKLNPDWSVVLYVPKEVNKEKKWKTFHSSDSQDYKQEFDYKGLLDELAIKIVEVDFSKTIVNNAGEAQRSDYLRWHLLYEKGGAWFDMDILFIKPLVNMDLGVSSKSEVDIINCFDSRHNNEQPIGALFSSIKNDYYKSICLEVKKCTNFDNYQAIGTVVASRIAFSKESLEQNFPNLKKLYFDYELFYLLDYQNLNQIYNNNVFTSLKDNDKVIGIHWYGGDTLTSQFNNLINKNNYHTFDNTICSAIKHILEMK